MKKSNVKYQFNAPITIDGITYTSYIVKSIQAKKEVEIALVADNGNILTVSNFKTVKAALEYAESLKGMYELQDGKLVEMDADIEADTTDENSRLDYIDDYFKQCKKALETSDTTVLIPVMNSQIDGFKLERIDCIFDKYVNPIESARIEFKNAVVFACIDQQQTIFSNHYDNLLDRGFTKSTDADGNVIYIDRNGNPIKEKNVIFYNNYINLWVDKFQTFHDYCWDAYTSAVTEAGQNIPLLIASEVAGTKLPDCFEYESPEKKDRSTDKPINKIIDLAVVYWKNIGTDNFADCKKRLKNAVCDFYKTFLKHDADEVYNQFSGGCNDKMLCKIASKIEKTVRDKDNGKYKTIYSCYNNLAYEMRNIFLMQLQGAFTATAKTK